MDTEDVYFGGCKLVFSSSQAHCALFGDIVVGPGKSSIEKSIGSFDHDFYSQIVCPSFQRDTFISRNVVEPWFHIDSSISFILLVCGKCMLTFKVLDFCTGTNGGPHVFRKLILPVL